MKRWLLAFLTALMASAPVSAAITELVVIGDSLSDSGNADVLSGGIFPPVGQRASNGPVAAERLAELLGVSGAPAVAGGTNFAVDGAMTGVTNFNFLTNDPPGLPPVFATGTGMTSQVADFLSPPPAFDPDSTLFLVWGGANDLALAFLIAQQSGIPFVPEAAVGAAVGNLSDLLSTLIGAGGMHFLVPGLPDIGLTPLAKSLGAETAGQLSALSDLFNFVLAQTIADLAATSGVDLRGFDVASLQRAVFADPGAFGFSDVSTPCLDPNDPSKLAAGCPGFFYFDLEHPSAAAHRLLGDRFFAAISISQVPEPSSLALLVIACVVVGARRIGVARRAFEPKA